jgi:hypothetical protein
LEKRKEFIDAATMMRLLEHTKNHENQALVGAACKAFANLIARGVLFENCRYCVYLCDINLCFVFKFVIFAAEGDEQGFDFSVEEAVSYLCKAMESATSSSPTLKYGCDALCTIFQHSGLLANSKVMDPDSN